MGQTPFAEQSPHPRSSQRLSLVIASSALSPKPSCRFDTRARCLRSTTTIEPAVDSCSRSSQASRSPATSSSKSSKREQSSSSFMLGRNDAFLFLKLSQSRPLKNPCSFISYTPPAPSRFSASQSSRLRRSTASGESLASSGIVNVFLHYNIF